MGSKGSKTELINGSDIFKAAYSLNYIAIDGGGYPLQVVLTAPLYKVRN